MARPATPSENSPSAAGAGTGVGFVPPLDPPPLLLLLGGGVGGVSAANAAAGAAAMAAAIRNLVIVVSPVVVTGCFSKPYAKRGNAPFRGEALGFL